MKTIFDDFAIHRYHEDIYGKDNAFYSGSFLNTSDGTFMTFTLSNKASKWSLSGSWLELSYDFASAEEAFEFLEDQVQENEEKKNTTFRYPKESKPVQPDCLDRFKWDDVSITPINSSARILHVDTAKALIDIRVFHDLETLSKYSARLEFHSKDTSIGGMNYEFHCEDDITIEKFLVESFNYINEWLHLDAMLPEFHTKWKMHSALENTSVAYFAGGKAYITYKEPLYEVSLTSDDDKLLSKTIESFTTEEEALIHAEKSIRKFFDEA